MSSSSDTAVTQVAVAVVEHDGNYLIGRRPEDVPLGGLWEFPGGKLQGTERPGAAAIRECLEETGIEVIVIRHVRTVDYTYPHSQLRLYFFLCQPTGSLEAKAGYRWVSRGELSAYSFPPANAQVIEDLTG